MGPAVNAAKVTRRRSGNHCSYRIRSGGERSIARVGGDIQVLLLAWRSEDPGRQTGLWLLERSRLNGLAVFYPDVLLHGNRCHPNGQVGVRVALFRRAV